MSNSTSAAHTTAASPQPTASQSKAGNFYLQACNFLYEQRPLEQASNAYLCQPGRTVAISDNIDSNNGGDKLETEAAVGEHVTPLTGVDACNARAARSSRIARCHRDALPGATMVEEVGRGRGGRQGTIGNGRVSVSRQRPIRKHWTNQNQIAGSRPNAASKTMATETLLRTGTRSSTKLVEVEVEVEGVAEDDAHGDRQAQARAQPAEAEPKLWMQSKQAMQAKRTKKQTNSNTTTTKQARQGSCACARLSDQNASPSRGPGPSPDADADPRRLGLQAQEADDALQADIRTRANEDRDILPDQPASTPTFECSERRSASTVSAQGGVVQGQPSCATLASPSHGLSRMNSDEQQWSINRAQSNPLLSAPNQDPPPLPRLSPLPSIQPHAVPAPCVRCPAPWPSPPPPPPSLSNDAGLGIPPVEKYGIATSGSIRGGGADNSQRAPVVPRDTTQRAFATTHDSTNAKPKAPASPSAQSKFINPEAGNCQIRIDQDTRPHTPLPARRAPPRLAQRQTPPPPLPAPLRSAHGPTLERNVIAAGYENDHDSHQPPAPPSQEQQVLREAPPAAQRITVPSAHPKDLFPDNIISRSVNGVRCLLELNRIPYPPVTQVYTVLALVCPWLDAESGYLQFSWRVGDVVQMDNYIDAVLESDQDHHDALELELGELKECIWDWLAWWTEHEEYESYFRDGAWPEPKANGVL